MTQKGSQPAPLSAQLLEMIFGFALSRSIAVAAQFGVADLLKDGPKNVDELAQLSAHIRVRCIACCAG